MSNSISAKRIELSSVDLSWIVGRSVASYSFSGPDSWIIALSGGGYISTQSIWRLVSASEMLVSSADHGHQFGLSAPVDVAAKAMSATSAWAVVDASVASGAPDLIIRFENELVLQVLATSTGYEAWQVSTASGDSTVVSGSRVASAWVEEPNV